VNRSAFLVRPKEPYILRAASIDDDPVDAAEALRDHCSVYLAPEDPRGESETVPLANFFKEIFEMELEAWNLDESQWPKTRDLETFERWFDVTGQSIIVDLGTSRLQVEEL